MPCPSEVTDIWRRPPPPPPSSTTFLSSENPTPNFKWPICFYHFFSSSLFLIHRWTPSIRSKIIIPKSSPEDSMFLSIRGELSITCGGFSATPRYRKASMSILYFLRLWCNNAKQLVINQLSLKRLYRLKPLTKIAIPLIFCTQTIYLKRWGDCVALKNLHFEEKSHKELLAGNPEILRISDCRKTRRFFSYKSISHISALLTEEFS
jgi:hypothetical protein